jgi:heme/copper-type cytochrome/quinol oxidase subunit 3
VIAQIQMIQSQTRKKYGDTNYIGFLFFLDVNCVTFDSTLHVYMELQQRFPFDISKFYILLTTLSKFKQNLC